MVKKEFVQVWRDRRLRIFLFLPPIIQLIVYGYAINFDIKQVPFAIFDIRGFFGDDRPGF